MVIVCMLSISMTFTVTTYMGKSPGTFSRVTLFAYR